MIMLKPMSAQATRRLVIHPRLEINRFMALETVDEICPARLNGGAFVG
jgi:hypothetical protein